MAALARLLAKHQSRMDSKEIGVMLKEIAATKNGFPQIGTIVNSNPKPKPPLNLWIGKQSRT